MSLSHADGTLHSSRPDAGATFFCDSPGLGLLAISGPDAEAFLQGQLSSDILLLTSGTVQLSSYNSAKGRMLATLVIWRDGTESFRALVAAELAEPLRKRLSMYVLRSKVTVADIAPAHALLWHRRHAPCRRDPRGHGCGARCRAGSNTRNWDRRRATRRPDGHRGAGRLGRITAQQACHRGGRRCRRKSGAGTASAPACR